MKNRIARIYDVIWPIILFTTLIANTAISISTDDPVLRMNHLLSSVILLLCLMMHKPIARASKAFRASFSVRPGQRWVMMNEKGEAWAVAPIDTHGTLDLDFTPTAKEPRG